MDQIKSCVGATARKVPSGWGLDGISSAKLIPSASVIAIG